MPRTYKNDFYPITSPSIESADREETTPEDYAQVPILKLFAYHVLLIPVESKTM